MLYGEVGAKGRDGWSAYQSFEPWIPDPCKPSGPTGASEGEGEGEGCYRGKEVQGGASRLLHLLLERLASEVLLEDWTTTSWAKGKGKGKGKGEGNGKRAKGKAENGKGKEEGEGEGSKEGFEEGGKGCGH